MDKTTKKHSTTCTITACNAGFDNAVDATQCQQTPAQYYSPVNDKTRTACPTPSGSSATTTTGLSSVDGCFTCDDTGYTPVASTCEKLVPDALSLGDKESYVLYNSGEVEGWGAVGSDPWVFNSKIDLGTVNGTKDKAQAIEAGENHRCVILKNGATNHGAVKCWGVNNHGQLGIVGDTNDRDTPTDITALGNDTNSNPYTAKSLALGTEHSCAILNDGKVKCWGRNNYGQIGGNVSGSEITLSGTAGDPLNGATATAIAAYDYTCAILSNGSVKCWGSNYFGTTAEGVPSLGNGRTATGVAAGQGYSCALKNGENIGCRGWRGSFAPFSPLPLHEDFSPFSDPATHVTAGEYALCAILTDKTVKCWVYNANFHYGEIGGSATMTPPPLGRVIVRGTSSGPIGNPLDGEAALSLAMGKRHTCAITETDKSIKCWGKNNDGQIIGTLKMEGGIDGTGKSTGETEMLTANATPSASALETDAYGKVCALTVTDSTNGIILQYATPLTYNSFGSTSLPDAIDNLISVVGPLVKLGGSTITLTKHADTDKIEATVDIPIFDGMMLGIVHDDDAGDCLNPVATEILLSGSTTVGATAKGLWVISDDYVYSNGADQLINLDGVEIDLGTTSLSKDQIADEVVGKISGGSWKGQQYPHLPYMAAKVQNSDNSDCPYGDFCVEFARHFSGSAGNNGIPFGDRDYNH